ncbi:unnamed protein product [Diatraea saccharalis]|uniref:Arrestin C-terminal-like domain-containing protein n=1 Tax=Diatraea saccharalis TaxID=40085 RepID=A0A9N9WCZ8_9NEOP|nr:unnamed protein product [Diatraea saccharalis]
MAVHCQFSVNEPRCKVFTPGSAICGTMRYEFDEETIVRKISVSLEGFGRLQVNEGVGYGYNEDSVSDCNLEDIFYSEDIIDFSAEGTPYLTGQYGTTFNFWLPENIPPSLHYCTNDLNLGIFCEITYFLRIRFHVGGFAEFQKTFEKEIKVAPSVMPRLPTLPMVYGEKKTFFHLCKRNNFIYLKACVKNSIINPGQRVQICYEVENQSSTTVQAIKIKLVEMYMFSLNENDTIKFYVDVEGTDSKTAMIKSGDIKEYSLEIDIEPSLHSVDYSKIVSRNYAVIIIISLPIPYKNMMLEIPIQIGKCSRSQLDPHFYCVSNNGRESPPSYGESTT